MELKILKENTNPLFKRKEIEGIIKSESAPANEKVMELLSRKYSTPVENIKIKKIKGKFGAKEFGISANIYNSKEEKDTLELKKKKDIEFEKKMSAPKEKTEEQKEN